MSRDLDDLLRRALRPTDPGEAFTQRVMSRIAREPQGPARAYSFRDAAFHGSWIAIAASLALAILVAHEWQVRRMEQGLKARSQLIEALRVTDQKLELAYRVMNDVQRRAGKDSGA